MTVNINEQLDEILSEFYESIYSAREYPSDNKREAAQDTAYLNARTQIKELFQL